MAKTERESEIDQAARSFEMIDVNLGKREL